MEPRFPGIRESYNLRNDRLILSRYLENHGRHFRRAHIVVNGSHKRKISPEYRFRKTMFFKMCGISIILDHDLLNAIDARRND